MAPSVRLRLIPQFLRVRLNPHLKPCSLKLVPYDESLLQRAHTQWQLGDWQSLAQLNLDTLQHHPDRAKLALLAAAGLLQTGQDSEAKTYVRLAQDWGIGKKIISQILIAGVHNSIGRAAAISSQQALALQHFESAIYVGIPGDNIKLFSQARAREQLSQLGLATGEGFIKVNASWPASENGFQLSSPGIVAKSVDEKHVNFSSAVYWEERYQKGGTSGHGSYGRLAEFKAKVINKFIKDEGIERVIEFGCGDGNQLSMLRVKNYIGIDISPAIVGKCKDKFKNDASKSFLTTDEYMANPLRGDLTLSLDVIFHLIEDDVFENYMDILLSASTRYSIVYASNSIAMSDPAIHVRHRNFTEWIKRNNPDWRLMQIIYNKYPHDGSVNPKDSSFSDFYFYERK